jgi:peptide/nickel transport system substrate-binding protein
MESAICQENHSEAWIEERTVPTGRTSVLASAALAIAVVASACSNPATSSGTSAGGSGGSTKAGGTLTVALAEEPDDLDPTTAATFVGRIVFANMCEKLYDVNASLNVIPQLATALPTISADGKTYTIKLRPGVKFNDGTPFNAQAVKTTLMRDKTDPNSARASELDPVKTINVLNPTTVQLKLSTPYSPLTAILADRSGMIESPTQLKKLGSKFGQHPVCVGPFSFADRPSSDKIDLVKSNFYYDKSAVKLNKVTFEVVTQPNVRAANVRSGDVNVSERLAPQDVKALQSSSSVTIKQVTSLGYDDIDINVSNSNGAAKPPFNTVGTPLAQHADLRQAFALSLNRDTINNVVNDGQYAPDCTPISPVSPYAPGITCPPQNIAKAKQLVAQSGVKTPIPVHMIVQASNDQATKLGEVVQSMAKQAGFAVKVTPTEFTTALTQAQAGKFDTFDVGWSGRIDPDQDIAQFYQPDSTLNYTGAHDPATVALMAKARETTNFAARKADYRKLCEMFLQQNTLIYLDHPKYALAFGNNVHGIQYFGDGLVRLKTASLGG